VPALAETSASAWDSRSLARVWVYRACPKRWASLSGRIVIASKASAMAALIRV
jgi:hypothetical protein